MLYDVQSSFIQHPVNDDIVIISVDENSLQALGRWPWSRDIHAALINKLSHIDTRAILIDMIFAEPSSNTAVDQHLASAMQTHGNVILPVLLEQTRLQGQLIETLPIPELTRVANRLGHVHVELDQDGIARSSFLYEGLGEPRWPHISLAVHNSLFPDKTVRLVTDSEPQEIQSRWSWIRKDPFLIPYIGPPGSFQRISYINVLQDDFIADTLKDKIILIGVTAAGLGDSLPTPVSGLSHPMPGIEINANILNGILTDSLISSVSKFQLYVIAAILILLPIMAFPFLSPRVTLLLVSVESVLIFMLSLMLLHYSHIWVPASALLLCIALSYPLWAWRRLEFTVDYLNNELLTLKKETDEVQKYVASDVSMSFYNLQELVPLSGITVFDTQGNICFDAGKSTTRCSGKLNKQTWSRINDNVYGLLVQIHDNTYRVCIQWRYKEAPDEFKTKTLKTYLRQQIRPSIETGYSTVEIIENRINEIRNTTEKLSYLRQIVTDSLEQMADAVIVIDSLGSITVANQQAARLLDAASAASLLQESIVPRLSELAISTGESWEQVIQSLLMNRSYENLQVSTPQGFDLIVNIRPLYSGSNISGFIINLSDITELKNTQRRRNEMLSFLSHDLRSPLVSALALLHTDAGNIKSSGRIIRNINHTIELAEDFVHLSRLEGEDEIRFKGLNVEDVVSNAIDTVWDQANQKNIGIDYNCTELCWVKGNGAILERVIVNLLTNAVKYSHEGCRIQIDIYPDRENIIIEVCDNGPGIDANELPVLFDRFKRAKSRAGKQSGIGLGLAFVYAAIQKHHGEINVKSEIDQGTCFTINLPADNEQDS